MHADLPSPYHRAVVDPAPYLLAVVTALVGAAAGYVGNALKTKAAAREP